MMCGIVVFFEEWYCPVYSQKNSCVVVALEVSYYRITYRITVLPCITVLLVRLLQLFTACYRLLWSLPLVMVVIACYGCYRLLRLLPLVTASYRLL